MRLRPLHKRVQNAFAKIEAKKEEPHDTGTTKTTADGTKLYQMSYRGRTVWVSIPE